MKKIATLALLICCSSALRCGASVSPPLSYTSGPTFGTVVDDATGTPVAGAVVVAQWTLEGGMHVDKVGVLVVRETMTDASGNFRIEGWGPIQRSVGGVLDALDPEVLIFKPGASSWSASNWGLAAPGSRVGLTHREWLRNGGKFRLKDVSSTASAREQKGRVINIRISLARVIESTDCKWTQIPRAISLLEKELVRVAGPSVAMAGSGRDFLARNDCGPLVDFKRAYEEIR